MKKLLVLSLVLGIASLASAALTIVPESLVLYPSDIITIDIVADAQAADLGAVIGVVVDGPGTISVGENTANLLNPGAIFDLPGDQAGLFGYGTAVFADLAKPEIGAMIPDGVVISGLTFHCEGEGDVIIQIFNPDSGLVDEITIAQMPEPATMALLGLGALVLRRKK